MSRKHPQKDHARNWHPRALKLADDLLSEKKAAIESEIIRHLYKSIMNGQIDDFKNSSNLLNYNSLIIDISSPPDLP